MASYKLYVAVVAIASIAAVQEGSCADSSAERSDVPEQEVSEPEMMEDGQCEEYKSKIWDKAFGNPEAMKLMGLTLDTAKEMGSDDVCTDTTRSFFDFYTVMATSQNAHYTLGMLGKMLAFIVRESDTTSEKFQETKKVLGRIMNEPAIRDYVKHFTVRTVDLLKESEIRGRLFTVVKAFERLVKPSENEQMVKQRIMGLTNAPAKMAKGAMNSVGNFFRSI